MRRRIRASGVGSVSEILNMPLAVPNVCTYCNSLPIKDLCTNLYYSLFYVGLLNKLSSIKGWSNVVLFYFLFYISKLVCVVSFCIIFVFIYYVLILLFSVHAAFVRIKLMNEWMNWAPQLLLAGQGYCFHRCCLSVSTITQKVTGGFSWNFQNRYRL